MSIESAICKFLSNPKLGAWPTSMLDTIAAAMDTAGWKWDNSKSFTDQVREFRACIREASA